MPDFSINAPQKQGRTISEWVWFEGATALLEGQGVCYNWDYGTAASSDARRYNRVEVPTILNARHFAGVAARNYSAKANGQLIEIYRPGSVCNVLSRANNTIGVGLTTCEAGGTYAGYFNGGGFEGEGTAVPLQTIDRSGTAGLCLATLQVGPPSGLIEYPTLTAAGGAHTFMVGGVTVFATATTLAANATFTLADSTIPGLKKAFKCAAAMTTSEIVITVTSGKMGVGNADPTGTLATISENADDEEVELRWFGNEANGHWYVTGVLGSVLS